jgi:hypothetical protein
MEAMVFVKVSLVSDTSYRRRRAKELAQSGEKIGRGGWRGINVCSKQKLPLPGILGSFIRAIRSLSGVRESTGSDALLRGIPPEADPGGRTAKC